MEIITTSAEVSPKKPRFKRVFNPAKVISDVRKDAKQEKETRLRSCAAVINQLPEEFQKTLVIVSKRGKIITPEESFVKYFKNFRIKYDDPSCFAVGFVEIFFCYKEKMAKEIEESKKAGAKDHTKVFWKHFEVLFNRPIWEKKIATKVHRVWYVKFRQWFKCLFSVSLDGTGKYNVFARNNR